MAQQGAYAYSGLMRLTETTDTGNLTQQWLDLTADERVTCLRSLRKADADELFLRLSTFHQLELLLHMPTTERGAWLRLLAPDDAADLIQAAGTQQLRESLLDLLDEVGRREVSALMAYKQDRAGGLDCAGTTQATPIEESATKPPFKACPH